MLFSFFFFNDTATTEIYTFPYTTLFRSVAYGELAIGLALVLGILVRSASFCGLIFMLTDRKSTRLNSSHGYISYAVFCLKKKNMLDHARSYIVEFACLTLTPSALP